MINLLLIMLASGIALSVYAESNNKGKHEQDFTHSSLYVKADWSSPKKAVVKINPIISNRASLSRGEKLYFQNCAICHGKTAEGNGPLASSLNPNPANLRKFSGIQTDGDIAWKINNGRGAMPAWEGVLSENQIWDLVNYIQALKSPVESKDQKKEQSDENELTEKNSH